MKYLMFVLALMFSFSAGSYPVFHTLTSPSFANKAPGPDGFVGTADDVTATFPNTMNTSSYTLFSGWENFGGAYSYSVSTFSFNQDFVVVGNKLTATDFSVNMNTMMFNSPSTSADLKTGYHYYEYDPSSTYGGSYSQYTLHTVNGTLYMDTDFSNNMGGVTILRGQDPNDFVLPHAPGTPIQHLPQAQIDYFNLMSSLAPSNWTALYLNVQNNRWVITGNHSAPAQLAISGSLAGMFVGRRADIVIAMYSTDSFSIVPEPNTLILLGFGLAIIAAKRRN